MYKVWSQIWTSGTGISLVVGALGLITSNQVVKEQAALVIGVLIFGCSRLMAYLLPRWNPPRVPLSAAPTHAGFVGSEPFDRSWGGDPGEAAQTLPGREDDAHFLVHALLSDQASIRILSGEVGTGKTSLIRAEILPQLRAAGAGVWDVTRIGSDPLEDVRAAGLAALRDANQSPVSDTPRDDVLAADSHRRLVIVLDGFEFAYLGPGAVDASARGRCIDWLRQHALGGDNRLRVLIAVTPEHAGRLSNELRQRGVAADAVQTRRLNGFSKNLTRDVLETLAGRQGFALERRLCARVARDLLDGAQVWPAELQTIGTCLCRRGIDTLPGYYAAGGAGGIWSGYLADLATPETLRRVAGGPLVPGTDAERAALDGLLTDHILVRTAADPDGYAPARPSLARWLHAASDGAGALSQRVAAAHSLVARLAPLRILTVLAGALTLGVLGGVVWLLVGGYPDGPYVRTLPPPPPPGGIERVAYDPARDRIAADMTRQILVWNLSGGGDPVSLSTDSIDPSTVTQWMAFAEPNELRLYAADGQTWAWDLGTGGEPIRVTPAVPREVKRLDCIADPATVDYYHRRLAVTNTCGGTAFIDVFDLEQRTWMTSLQEDKECRPILLALAPDGNQLLDFHRCAATTSTGGQQPARLSRWSISTGERQEVQLPSDLPGEVVQVLFSDHGNVLALVSTRQGLQLWDLSNDVLSGRWQPTTYYISAPLVLSPNRDLLAYGDNRDGVQLYRRGWWPFDFVPAKLDATQLFGALAQN